MRNAFSARVLSLMVLVLSLTCGLSTSTGAAAPASPAGQTVTMSDSGFNFQFTPKSLTVPVGTTVTWTNAGQLPHTATSDTAIFNTGDVLPGQSASFTFQTPGTFPYHCMHHGAPGGIGMSGTITVVAYTRAVWLPLVTQ